MGLKPSRHFPPPTSQFTMASPPYSQNYGSALSPPYSSHSQLPQPLKRRHTDMPSSAPLIKRRKASMLSTTSTSSTHPLRQTSFPPELDARSPAYSRSPSMDTVSLAGSVAGSKRKRGRKSKGKDFDDGASTAGGGRGQSAALGNGRGREGTREATEEAEADDDLTEDPQTVTSNTEESAREKERLAVLNAAFDPDQETRYSVWRQSKLSEPVTRRVCLLLNPVSLCYQDTNRSRLSTKPFRNQSLRVLFSQLGRQQRYTRVS